MSAKNSARLWENEKAIFPEDVLLHMLHGAIDQATDPKHKRSLTLLTKITAPILQEMDRSDDPMGDLEVVVVAMGYAAHMVASCYPRMAEDIAKLIGDIMSTHVPQMARGFMEGIKEYEGFGDQSVGGAGTVPSGDGAGDAGGEGGR